MKMKIVWIVCLLVLLCLPAGLALADNGPHGGYTPTTDACAACHRAHTADAEALLLSPMPGLCFTCHGNTGNGADTNVVDGVYVDRDAVAESPAEQSGDSTSLKGGGFVNAKMDTNWDGVSDGVISTTSDHLNAGQTVTDTVVWGYGEVTTVTYPGLPAFDLSCGSCHDPHGGAGYGGAPTYRLLRLIPNGISIVSGTTFVTVTDEISKIYTLSDARNEYSQTMKAGDQYFGEGYPDYSSTWQGALDAPEDEMAAWCAQCHTRYLADESQHPGREDSGDDIFHFRHQANDRAHGCSFCHDSDSATPHTDGADLRPGIYSGPFWSHTLRCATCHVAHGTSAAMGTNTYSSLVEWPGDAVFTGPGDDSRSSLLRLDGRGVCEVCHGKGGLTKETDNPYWSP